MICLRRRRAGRAPGAAAGGPGAIAVPAPAGPAGPAGGRQRGIGPEGAVLAHVLAHVVGERRLVLAVSGPRFRGRLGAALVLPDQGERARGQVGMPGSGGGRGADERRQFREDGRGRRPVPRAALQAGSDDGSQLGRQAGEVRRLGGQPDEDVHHGVALVGRVPGRREQQGRAEREHVAGHGRLPGVPGLLRGHVRGRAQRAPGHGELDPLGGPGHPEIDHAGAVGRDEHVGRLQVPVHQPGVVDRLQRLGAAGGQPAHRRDRERPAPPDQAVQRRRRDVGGGQPGHVRVGVRGHDRRGEHPADPPRGRDLMGEPGPETGLVGKLDLDGLDRHQAARGGPAQVHLAHRPGAETPEERERPDPFRIPPAQRRQCRLRNHRCLPRVHKGPGDNHAESAGPRVRVPDCVPEMALNG